MLSCWQRLLCLSGNSQYSPGLTSRHIQCGRPAAHIPIPSSLRLCGLCFCRALTKHCFKEAAWQVWLLLTTKHKAVALSADLADFFWCAFRQQLSGGGLCSEQRRNLI